MLSAFWLLGVASLLSSCLFRLFFMVWSIFWVIRCWGLSGVMGCLW